MNFPTLNQWLRQNQEEDQDPGFGFGTSSSRATAQATAPSYSSNPTSPGVDSGAQGTRNDPDETDAIATMRATTDEISRSGRQTVDLYNSPGTQRMLDNQTARSRSADSWQDQRGRGNTTFANQMQQQNQATAFGQQKEQMGWAQDVALGGQPGSRLSRGSTTVSIERQYSPFNTFMNTSSVVGSLGGFYATQSADRANERQASLQGASMMMDDRFRNNQLGLQADSIGLDDRYRNNQLQLQTDSIGLDDRFRNNQMGLDDRYRNRSLAIDSIMRANQRSLWSSPLEQIALNQARQPGMVR